MDELDVLVAEGIAERKAKRLAERKNPERIAKRRGGQAAKRKGDQHELEVENLLYRYGFIKRRDSGRAGGKWGGDLVRVIEDGKVLRVGEVKYRANFAWAHDDREWGETRAKVCRDWLRHNPEVDFLVVCRPWKEPVFMMAWSTARALEAEAGLGLPLEPITDSLCWLSWNHMKLMLDRAEYDRFGPSTPGYDLWVDRQRQRPKLESKRRESHGRGD